MPLGNGVFELLVGVTAALPVVARVTAFDTLLATIPLGGNDDPPPGTELGSPASLTIVNRLGAAVRCFDWLDAYAAVDVQWMRDVDEPAAGAAGRTLFFATLGVVGRGPEGTTLELSWRVAHRTFAVGVGKTF